MTTDRPTNHDVELPGCSPTPLANYLKAIGVLRLVSAQADRRARGWWRGDRFWLRSTLSADDLVDFFLNDYQPTPLIAPWNGGSGFYPKDKTDGIEAIESGQAPRFETYRQAISAGRSLIADPDTKPSGEPKDRMLQRAEREFRGPLREWLRAAMIIDGEGSPTYPAILGTGGNDGRLDFTNNFMQRLTTLYDAAGEGRAVAETASFIRASLLDEPVSDLMSVSIGQFSPGAVGGANSGAGFGGTSAVNPVDFVLMLEGAVAFTPAMVRRSGSKKLPGAAAPFALFEASSGFATSGADEKSRGEQWMPLWSRPASFGEFQKVLGQGRLRIQGSTASRPRDAVRAIARSGSAVGIDGFVRYAYLERNGQANLAIPVDRYQVCGPVIDARLVDDIVAWMDRLEGAARGKTAPASWTSHQRRLNTLVMNCCRRVVADDWVRLLAELGRTETTLLRSGRATAGADLQPLPPLDAGWVDVIGQVDEPEVRLAIALASQTGPSRISDPRPSDRARTADHDRPTRAAGDPIRRHFVPLATRDDGTVDRRHRFARSDQALHHPVDFLARGGVAVEEAAAIVHRRITLAAGSGGAARMPIVPRRGFEASLNDLTALVEGRVDVDRVFQIARPLMAVRWNDVKFEQRPASRPGPAAEWDAARGASVYGVWRMCHHWSRTELNLASDDQGVNEGTRVIDVRLDPRLINLMSVGRTGEAVAAASHRLKVSGVPVLPRTAVVDPARGRLWVASLLWSVSDRSIQRLADVLIHRPGLLALAESSRSADGEFVDTA